MKRIMFISALMCFTLATSSQNIKYPCQDLIESGDYKTAADKIRNELSKDRNNIEWNIAQAMLLSNDGYKKNNTEKAYKIAITAKDNLAKLNPKQLKKLEALGIDEQSINLFIESLKDKYFTLLYDDKNSEDKMNKFIKSKNAPEEHKRIIKHRIDSIVAQRELDIKTKKHIADSIVLASYIEANNAKKIVVMEKMFKQYKCIQESMWCLQQIFNIYADYGDSYAFYTFENKYGKLHPNDPIMIGMLEHGRQISNMYNLAYNAMDKDQNHGDIDTYIKNAAPCLKAIHFLQFLIQNAVKKNDWNLALNICYNYAPYFGNDKRFRDMIGTISAQTNYNIKPYMLDLFATSEFNSHYAPTIRADGKALYFTASNVSGIGATQNEMIYETTLNKNGKYEKNAVCITPFELQYRRKTINIESTGFTSAFSNEKANIEVYDTLFNNTCPEAVSTTGNEMIFFLNGDLCLMQKTIQGWKRIRGTIKTNIRDVWQADMCLASNGKAMLFSSELPNEEDIHKSSFAHDHANIYVSLIDSAGHWSKPIDLGPTINTMGCDRSPFLHPDMKTLYFSSDGHGGLGSLDVYVSTRLSDTCWTCWSEPVNIGKEYNTAGNDWGYVISTDGKKAYYSREITRKVNYQGQPFEQKAERIFCINMTDDIMPGKVCAISGKVLDTEGHAINGEVVWEDLDNGIEMGRSSIDPQTGDVYIVLPGGKNYGYYISNKKMFPLSGNVDLKDIKDFTEIKKDFRVCTIEQMIQEHIAMPLNNLFFDKGQCQLKNESKNELKRVAELIKRTKHNVEISGHTDNTGNEDNNVSLSTERAENVKEYLIQLGCNADQLIAKGYGSSKPVNDNKTEAARKRNRRVELRFINNEQ